MKFCRVECLEARGNCTRGAWRALLPLRMKILPGRTSLKTLDPMALCTDHCLPPSFGTFSRTVILLWKYSGCLEICRKLLDSICRFSFLKRCSYSLYSDTMLNIGPIRIYILMDTHNVEQTRDVRMYIEEFILVDIWIHCCTKLNCRLNDYIGRMLFLYTLATKD